MTGVWKVYLVAFLCHGVVKQYTFESARAKHGQGRIVIMDKGHIQRLEEERRREERWVGDGEGQ